MKKFFWIFLVIEIISVVAVVVGISMHNGRQEKTNLYTYYIDGRRVQLLVADNLAEWEKGLMYQRKLTNADGMVFLFPDKQVRTFWNKNTLMDLDIYWYNDDKLVGKSILPSIEKSINLVTVSSSEEVNKVIEMPR